MILDTNNILAIGDIKNEGKEYSRMFFGRPLQAYDHTILVVTKHGCEQKQWKDLGHGQTIVKVRSTKVIQTMPYNLGYARLGFDMLYKYDEEIGQAINIAKPDKTILSVAEKMFGSTKTALVVPSYDGCLLPQYVGSLVFGLVLAHGTWTLKSETLFPIKITIPLTSSLLGRKEFFVQLTDALYAHDILHSVQWLSSGTYDIVQLTLHDPALLDQFVQWVNPIVKIAKISTLDYAQKIYQKVFAYAQDHGYQLPCDSADDLMVLVSD